MNLLDILASVILLGSAYLLLFTALVHEVEKIDEPPYRDEVRHSFVR